MSTYTSIYKYIIFVLLHELLLTIEAAAVSSSKICRLKNDCDAGFYCPGGIGRCTPCSEICTIDTEAMRIQCQSVCPGYSIPKENNNMNASPAVPAIAAIIPSVIFLAVIFGIVYYVVFKKGLIPCKRDNEATNKRRDGEEAEAEAQRKLLDDNTSKMSPEHKILTQRPSSLDVGKDSDDNLSLDPMLSPTPDQVTVVIHDQPSEMTQKQPFKPNPPKGAPKDIDQHQQAVPWSSLDSDEEGAKLAYDVSPTISQYDSGYAATSPGQESAEGASLPGMKVVNDLPPTYQKDSEALNTGGHGPALPQPQNQQNSATISNLNANLSGNMSSFNQKGEIAIYAEKVTIFSQSQDIPVPKIGLDSVHKNVNPSDHGHGPNELVTAKDGGQNISSPVQAETDHTSTCIKTYLGKESNI